MSVDVGIFERPAAVLPGDLSRQLPARAFGEPNHPAEQTPVGSHAEDRGGDDPVEMRVRLAMIQQDDVLRRLRIGVPEMALDARFPVGMPDRGGAAREHELPGDEVVVGDRVGREMTEVAESERTQGVGAGEVVDLLTHVPEVTMPAQGGVVLRDRGVGRDVAVEKIEGIGAEEIRHRPRAGTGDCPEPTRPGRCVCPASRRGRRRGPPGGRAPRQSLRARGGQRHRRLATSSRRTRPSIPLPRRTERSAAATSSAVSSTSSCTTL